MFKRSQRLSRADFKDLDPKSRISGSLFILTTGPSGLATNKYACIVSKKVSSKATERNTIKRRCRAALRLLQAPRGKMFVFTAKSSSRDATYAEIKADVARLLGRITS